jgi:Tfp pilus assembly protein PilP
MVKKTRLKGLGMGLALLGLAWIPAAGEAQTPAGKRDPFVSPLGARAAGPASTCTTGKRCLVIGQVTLKGVVRSESGMIAVVENAARRVYFLRENEPVFDGQVVRITGDSIVFRESVSDGRGKVTHRDVVKRLPSSSPA